MKLIKCVFRLQQSKRMTYLELLTYNPLFNLSL